MKRGWRLWRKQKKRNGKGMAKKNYFNTCPYCGGNNDPGEKCDCRKMKGRSYTNLEGAGHKVVLIGYMAKK